jgi:hypothetical protein
MYTCRCYFLWILFPKNVNTLNTNHDKDQDNGKSSCDAGVCRLDLLFAVKELQAREFKWGSSVNKGSDVKYSDVE